MKPLPGLARPVAACAALALAGHSALLALALWGPGEGSATGGGPAQARAMHVSLRQASTTLDERAETPAAEAQRSPAAGELATPTHGSTAEASLTAPVPRFVTLPAPMGMPDASLPEGGVRVNVLVRAGADGQPENVAIAVWPADAPPAYAEWAQRSLAEARLEPGAGAHCLQVAFETDLEEPRWAWRSLERAAADRCLSGRLPGPARPLSVR